jgi:LPXTG-site transpeptidase (sortase) family protein
MRGIPRRAAGLAMVVLRSFSRQAVGITVVVVLTITGAGLLVAAFNTSPPLRPPQPAAAAAPPPSQVSVADSPTPTPSRAPAPTVSAAPTATELPTVTPSPAVTPSPLGSPAPEPVQTVTPTPTPTPTKRVGMPRSTPVKISIPRIGVNAHIMKLGLDSDRTLQMPTEAQADLAGWYKYGPAPGQAGNSVVVGHVDSKRGPAVFFRLGALKPGDSIRIARTDGSVALFKVDGVKTYRKSNFPTGLVYGPSAKPQLRLVTCGGPWSKHDSYRDNTIVFASRVSAAARG